MILLWEIAQKMMRRLFHSYFRCLLLSLTPSVALNVSHGSHFDVFFLLRWIYIRAAKLSRWSENYKIMMIHSVSDTPESRIDYYFVENCICIEKCSWLRWMFLVHFHINYYLLLSSVEGMRVNRHPLKKVFTAVVFYWIDKLICGLSLQRNDHHRNIW